MSDFKHLLRGDLVAYRFSFTIGAILTSAVLFADPVTRGAIDFGSGAVKIQVSQVEENRIVGGPLLQEYVPLLVTEDVAVHGAISPGVEARAIEILAGFQTKAEAAAGGPVEYSGIATAIFRKAVNGQEVLDRIQERLGIPLQIVSQEVEGRLGLATAQALYPEVVPQRLIAWDSGNGSFQVTSPEGQVYQGPLGHGTVRVILSRDVRQGAVFKAEESGNPIRPQEALEMRQRIRAMLPPIPAWLAEQLKSGQAVFGTFGDHESIFAITSRAVAIKKGIEGRVSMMSRSDVDAIIEAHLNKTDAQIESTGVHRKVLTSALLLASVMEYLGVDQVQYRQALGSTSGMLITPELWNCSQPAGV
jgi:exopolyphosphatase/pppGpp-phosphohydrolase